MRMEETKNGGDKKGREAEGTEEEGEEEEEKKSGQAGLIARINQGNRHGERHSWVLYIGYIWARVNAIILDHIVI